MKEITGELWSYIKEPNHVICITTNGACNKKGELVMGRGCAKEAKDLFPWLPKLLCDQVLRHGNQPILASDNQSYLCSFPTKHKWSEKSDLKLISESAEHLRDIANRNNGLTFILPRPGCGNGGRTWEEVRPLLVDVLPDNVIVISND